MSGRNQLRGSRGFTLLEMLVASTIMAIAIVGLLSGIAGATRNAARYFGSRDFGTIEAGKAADLVLLNADPLADIRNTEKIEAVVMRGRYFSRQDLDAMLDRESKFAASRH